MSGDRLYHVRRPRPRPSATCRGVPRPFFRRGLAGGPGPGEAEGHAPAAGVLWTGGRGASFRLPAPASPASLGGPRRRDCGRRRDPPRAEGAGLGGPGWAQVVGETAPRPAPRQGLLAPRRRRGEGRAEELFFFLLHPRGLPRGRETRVSLFRSFPASKEGDSLRELSSRFWCQRTPPSRASGVRPWLGGRGGSAGPRAFRIPAPPYPALKRRSLGAQSPPAVPGGWVVGQNSVVCEFPPDTYVN